MKRLKIAVKGRVQGVHFRASTKAVADQLGVKGLICNLSDGAVYIEAEGDDFALDFFLDWCNEGPENAVIEAVEIAWIPLKNDRNFEIVKKVTATGLPFSK